MSFSPSRLTLARQRRGLTKKDLARQLEVAPQTITNWESGDHEPPTEAVRRLARELAFPDGFFSLGEIELLGEASASFRRRSRTSVREKGTALAAGTMVTELVGWLECHFELPRVQVPDLTGLRPEHAADRVRAEWSLGERPIPNMIHLVESKGVLVFSLAQDCLDIDAFSFWVGRRPVVMLNTIKSAERSRFDLAHELGHLVLHHHVTGRTEEGEADRFASSFLMPANDIRQHAPPAPFLKTLVKQKRRWGVSVAALAYRLHELGLVTDWQHRAVFVRLSRAGYRQVEPQPIQREASQILGQVLKSLRERANSLATLANDLRQPLTDLNEFLLGLAPFVGLPGSGNKEGGFRPRLSLVK